MIGNINCLFGQSQGCMNVETVTLSPRALDGQDDDVWDKVGRAISNLQALECLRIGTSDHDATYDDDEVVLVPDWEIQAHI
jgi:hypothetical protein